MVDERNRQIKTITTLNGHSGVLSESDVESLSQSDYHKMIMMKTVEKDMRKISAFSALDHGSSDLVARE